MIEGVAASRYEPFTSRLQPAMLGLWILITTEAFFFGILIASYLYLRVRNGVWPPPDSPALDLLLPAANTIVLLSSGLTMHGAVVSLKRGDSGLLKGGILATIILGCAFLAGQAFEYSHAGFGLSSGLRGSSFFTLTGFHGAHVLAGLLFLGLVLARTQKGACPQGRQLVVEAAGLYWHFVDAIWVVLFTILYVI